MWHCVTVLLISAGTEACEVERARLATATSDGRFNFSSESVDSVFPEALSEMATVDLILTLMTTLGFSFSLWVSVFMQKPITKLALWVSDFEFG